MIRSSFGKDVLSRGDNKHNISTALQVRRSRRGVPLPLKEAIRDEELEQWFLSEAMERLSSLPEGCTGKKRKNALEQPNRYADGSMEVVSPADLHQMSDFYDSPEEILQRAAQGRRLLRSNKQNPLLGTAARGVPCGGAGARAAAWARRHPQVVARFGLTEDTPRLLYRVGSRTLLHHTLAFSRHIARHVGRVFPNVLMTNSQVAAQVVDTIRDQWNGFTADELDSTLLFNQIVLPRMWVEDRKLIEGKLYPAGHGDFPFLLARYDLVQALAEQGVRYLFFSNADEWLWQPDPVMVSIARELFSQKHHMVIIGTRNINNQFGGGFVKMADGRRSLVETPRLPWDLVKQGQAPLLLNTTFYVIDVRYLARRQRALMKVKKSLVVKEVPARKKGRVEQILGVDSWAGDVFAELLNPAFIQWPRLNFLGIKNAGFITGRDTLHALGCRSYLHYVSEAVTTFPNTMNRLLSGDRKVAEELFNSGYSYMG